MRRCLPCLLTRLVLTREISKNAAKKKSLLGKFLGDPSHGDPLSAEKRVERIYIFEFTSSKLYISYKHIDI